MEIVNKCLTKEEFRNFVEDKDVGRKVNKIVLHHTYDTMEEWRKGKVSTEHYKKMYEEKGWKAGPHIFVAPEGIWLFTDISKEGRHANKGNLDSIGIEMVGRYNNKLPSGKIWNNTKVVIKTLLKKFDLSLKDVHFHREYNPKKDCPGRAVKKEWIRKKLSEKK